MQPSLRRSLIAIVASYAIALQALLSGWMVGTHLATASLGVICAHHSDTGTPDGNHAPGQDDCCPCGPACPMAGHGMVGVIERPSVVVAWAAKQIAVIASIDQAPTTLPDRNAEAHLPRAPPTA